MTAAETRSRILEFLHVDPVAVAAGQDDSFTAQRIADALGLPLTQVSEPLADLLEAGLVDEFGIRGLTHWYRLAEPGERPDRELVERPLLCPRGHRLTGRVAGNGRQVCDECQNIVPSGAVAEAAA